MPSSRSPNGVAIKHRRGKLPDTGHRPGGGCRSPQWAQGTRMSIEFFALREDRTSCSGIREVERGASWTRRRSRRLPARTTKPSVEVRQPEDALVAVTLDARRWRVRLAMLGRHRHDNACNADR